LIFITTDMCFKTHNGIPDKFEKLFKQLAFICFSIFKNHSI
jgi:hypothetical protein